MKVRKLSCFSPSNQIAIALKCKHTDISKGEACWNLALTIITLKEIKKKKKRKSHTNIWTFSKCDILKCHGIAEDADSGTECPPTII